jgi:hypothetical protein
MDELSHLEIRAHAVSLEKLPGTERAYLQRVFMKYAQFHALYEALKERVGSVRKLKTR